MSGTENVKTELSQAIVQLADRGYDDLLKGPFKEVGSTLTLTGRAINAVLGPVRGVVWSIERLEAWVEGKVVRRLEDRGVGEPRPVEPRVAVACLDHVRLLGDNHALQDMFANLLVSAMDPATAHLVHPAFPEILSQLNRDEAVLFEHFWRQSALRVAIVGRRGAGVFNALSTGHQPRVFLEERATESLARQDLVGFYLNNLHRLRLVELRPGKRFSAEYDAHAALTERGSPARDYIDQLETLLGEAEEVVNVEDGICELTELGQAFGAVGLQSAPVRYQSPST